MKKKDIQGSVYLLSPTLYDNKVDGRKFYDQTKRVLFASTYNYILTRESLNYNGYVLYFTKISQS